MHASPAVHPTDQTLSAFGLGKLDDAAAEGVGAHLEHCAACRQRVAELPPDSFLGRVREAQGSSAPPSSSVTGSPRLPEHPDYELKRELGRGGMGVVYLAYNTLLGRDEVLKVIGRQVIERPGVLDRFLREIRAVARLRHPNIVSAYSAARLGEGVVFAMEYVEGMDLAKLVRAKGPLPVAHACHFVSQAALGLQHAHEEGLVHRDIKPANLMLSRKGDRATVKVLDFGLAKATLGEKIDGGLTSHGQALGTPDFIAPEQILDAQKADIRADIYSLGGTLYYLLTGRPPFQADSLYDIYQAHMSREADALDLVRPEVPAELAAVVAKMLAKGPAQRFQTPAEVAAALRPFCTTRPAGARPEMSQCAPESPAPTVPNAPAPAQADVPWATLIDVSDAVPSTAPPAALSIEPSHRRPRRVWMAAAVGVIATGLLVCFIIVPRRNKDGKAHAAARPSAPVPAPAAPPARAAKDGPAKLAARPTWKPVVVAGVWRVDGDELVVESDRSEQTLLLSDHFLSAFDLRFKAKATTEGIQKFCAVFHNAGKTNECRFKLGNWDNTLSEIMLIKERKWSRVVGRGGPLEVDRWYDVRISIRGGEYRAYLDGAEWFFCRDQPLTEGRIGLGTHRSAARFKDIAVMDPDGNVLFQGLPDLASAGR